MARFTKEQIALALGRLRDHAKLEPAELARKAEFGQAVINRTEKPPYSSPTVNTFLKWLDALGVTPTDFFSDLEGAKPRTKEDRPPRNRHERELHDKLQEILEFGGEDAAEWISGNIITFHNDHVRRKRRDRDR